jgi:molybdopterin molybdotransferase
MLSVQEAERHIARYIALLPIEQVPLAQATGRVLRELLYADRDFPPFDRVTMDGIAIRYSDWAAGARRFQIEGMQAAGAPQKLLSLPQACFEVMTGAVLPNGADTVIRYEDLTVGEGVAAINVATIQNGQNVHRKGNDRLEDSVLLSAGRLLGSAEIGVAATVGHSSLAVSVLPRVALVSTGDELVDIDTTPLPHQIRRSNVHAAAAMLKQRLGIDCTFHHCSDDAVILTTHLAQVLAQSDVVVLSGGVSEGKFDLVPAVLAGLGVEKVFHKVAQRPGKPFWFGVKPGGPVIFALPGNPVSTFMCLLRYVLPFLEQCLGLPVKPTTFAVLSETVQFNPKLTYFLQVSLHSDVSGHLMAKPVPGQGSGDLANLTGADGFLELPAEMDVFEAGMVFRVWRYNN